jgi:hypothetical protein
MKPPSKIKIGHSDYTLVFVEDTKDYWGQHDAGKLRIELVKSLTGQRLADVLLHELFHALWSFCCIQDGEKEEVTVDRLSHAMAALIRDNPKLIAYLQELLK